MKQKLSFLLLAILSTLLLTSCASTGVPVSLIPADTQEKIGAACTKYDDFKSHYPEYRQTVIDNREWIEELMPNVWSALVEFDKHAKEVDSVVTLVCRILGGDKTAEAELDAKRIELQKQGVDWGDVINTATKIATLLL